MGVYKLTTVITHSFEMSEFGYERMLARGEAKNVNLESSEDGCFKGTYEKTVEHTEESDSEHSVRQKMAEGLNQAGTVHGYKFVSCELIKA